MWKPHWNIERPRLTRREVYCRLPGNSYPSCTAIRRAFEVSCADREGSVDFDVHVLTERKSRTELLRLRCSDSRCTIHENGSCSCEKTKCLCVVCHSILPLLPVTWNQSFHVPLFLLPIAMIIKFWRSGCNVGERHRRFRDSTHPR